MKFVNETVFNLNNNENTLAVYIDFTKAFDSVNHKILSLKLEHYGIRGNPLNLLKSYLTNRYQFVAIDNKNSSSALIVSGVPQGSVLGPLLFNIFINDITNTTTISKFIIFADDCTLLSKSPDMSNLTMITENSLKQIDIWTGFNKIYINFKKTKFMIFTYKSNLITDNINIKFNDFNIARVENFKLLGIYIDSRLKFNFHIGQIISKINIYSSIAKRIKKFLNKITLKILYYSMFYSHFFYCNLIWGCANKSEIDKLFNAQKKIVKSLFSSNFHNNAPIDNIFNNNNLLSIFEINSFKSCLFIFKILNNISITNDEHLNQICQYSVKSSKFYSTRVFDNYLINTTVAKNKLSERNFCYYGPLYWNRIPIFLKSLNNYYQFKKQLKTFYNCYS